MKKILVMLGVSISMFTPSLVFALSLGTIRVSSYQNERFNAEIPIFSRYVNEPLVRLYAYTGASNTKTLSGLRATVVKSKERYAIRITSKKRFKENNLKLHVRLASAQGVTGKTYTVAMRQRRNSVVRLQTKNNNGSAQGTTSSNTQALKVQAGHKIASHNTYLPKVPHKNTSHKTIATDPVALNAALSVKGAHEDYQAMQSALQQAERAQQSKNVISDEDFKQQIALLGKQSRQSPSTDTLSALESEKQLAVKPATQSVQQLDSSLVGGIPHKNTGFNFTSFITGAIVGVCSLLGVVGLLAAIVAYRKRKK